MKSVVLKGGLGNQLFQLATFLMLRNNQNFKDIKLDCSSGFILDLKYNPLLFLPGKIDLDSCIT